MTDTGRALGLRFEDDYRPALPPRWSQPWSSVAVRATTAVGALIVGFLLTTGVTAGREAAIEQGARKAQLIALVDARQDRAAALAEQLEELRARVTAAEMSVNAVGAAALSEKLARVEAMTGLTAIAGPGVRVTFSDAEGTCATGREEDCRIQDVDLQLAANTLWGSGAEAVAINGERIIATSAIRSAGSSVLINYRVLASPYVVEAIGDQDRLEAEFAASQLAEDFGVWRDVFGLGFDITAVEDLTLPAYNGAVTLESAVNVEPGRRVIALFALLVGATAGLLLQPTLPAAFAPYLPVAVIAALDALFGAVRARLTGTFSDRIFLVSFLSNVVLAVFLVFLGDQLNVGDKLETAVIVVFGVRIFQNLAAVRRHVFHA